ncbi:MAG TPA: hypothetical protein VG146_06185 [Verrucomicrobiae bacterium]|nr:hypothetical protein [Verrucomicrobiae bacterium]
MNRPRYNKPGGAYDQAAQASSPVGATSLGAEHSTSSELLILSDGNILVHNLTPALAAVLKKVVPKDSSLRRRIL